MGKRIAVIGAGAAGLSAAWRLQSSGARVVVYDSAPSVGGLLRTESVSGARIDTAVQLVSSTYTRLFALATDAGIRDMLVRASGNDALWWKGSAQAITYGSIGSMATSGALPTMLKLRLATKYAPFLTMHLGKLDANDPAATGGERHDVESIATWGERELGTDFVELLTYPLLAAYYGSPPEQTSAALYHALARVGMDVQVFAARGGMSAFAAGIARALSSRGAEIRTDKVVTGIVGNTSGEIGGSAGNGAWAVECAGSNTPEVCDGVIVATPPAAAAALIATAANGSGDSAASMHALQQWIRASKTHTAATVGITLKGTMRADYFGLSFPRNAPPGDRMVAVTVQQTTPADLIPADTSALTIFPAPTVVDRVASMDSAAAMSFFGTSLERVFPGIGARITGASVFAGDALYRDMGPGIVRRIQEFRALEMPHGIAIAGDYTWVPTVEGAVRSGERAAETMLRG